ncbi:transcription initiation factor IIA subunit 2, partial [Haematococcus lacustris]
NHVTARAHIKANLKTYRFFDNVWQFMLENVNFKLPPSGTGPQGGTADVSCARAKVVCVNAALLEDPTVAANTGAGPSGEAEGVKQEIQ